MVIHKVIHSLWITTKKRTPNALPLVGISPMWTRFEPWTGVGEPRSYMFQELFCSVFLRGGPVDLTFAKAELPLGLLDGVAGFGYTLVGRLKTSEYL
jgi:hypothetical protein